MTAKLPKSKGPFWHRFLVFCLSGAFSVLLLWLLGFVLSDLSQWEGPSYPSIESKYLTSAETTELARLEKQREDLLLEIEVQQERQTLLRKSTENSRTTMNQLLSLHQRNLQSDIRPTEEAQAALAKSQSLFLENQSKYEIANENITRMSAEKRQLDQRIDQVLADREEKRKPARAEHRSRQDAHDLKVAAIKLVFLLPLFLVAATLSYKNRKGSYRMIWFAMLSSCAWKVGTVMHEHFPSQFFKYIVLGVGILIVLLSLVKIIRKVTSPGLDWTLKQYREAYQKHRCPVCFDPILRGPFRYATWTRKGPKNPSSSSLEAGERGDEGPYSCPSCGVGLFEECSSCGHDRHALLPYCSSCGNEKELAASAS